MSGRLSEASANLSRRVVAPLLALMALLLLSGFVGFVKLTADQDTRELAESRHFAAELVHNLEINLARSLHDYASWGEAYRNLHQRFDIDWAYYRSNLGPSIYRDLGIDVVAVIAPSGDEIYTVERGVMAFPVSPRLEGDLPALIARIRAGEAPEDGLLGRGAIDGSPALIAVAAITPGSDRSVDPIDGPPSILVMVNRLDPATLAEAGARYLLEDLRATDDPRVARNAASLTFQSADRRVSLWLTWTPEAPGAEIIASVRPWLALAILAFAVVCVLMVQQGMRTAEMLDETSAKLQFANRQAEFHALHDDTTGLANRHKLARFAEIQMAARGGGVSLLFLDLDRFKPVNDAFGHETGDSVLRQIAERIETALPAGSLAARIGGDEFVVAAPLVNPADVAALCDRLIAAVGAPIHLSSAEIVVGVSIGIAIGPVEHGGFPELMRRADIALYEAKNAGRANYRFFAPHMMDAIVRRKALETDLREALARGQLALHFQPRVDVDGLNILGAEALLRWHHPKHGDVPPDEFIQIAEETGQIGAIGAWVLDEACRAAVHWPDIAVSVNVSAVQFRYDRLVDLVAETLERTGLAPHRLELEITESVLLDDRERATEVLRALKDLGVGLAIDDFGAGYSSLNYLCRYPFDKIKLDRGFLAGLAPSSETRAVVRAVIELGRALGMTVVAEGVETWDQLLLLRLEQCPEVQGFLTGRPMPAVDFAARLNAERADAARGAA